MLSVWIIAVLLALVGLEVRAEVSVPPLQARVTDLTGTLKMDEKAGLESRLAAFETEKGSQVAVLLVPTTEPETIEQYSIRVVDAWKLGRKGIDDGVLILLAKQDRTVRIEVGRGLEGVIPDAVANRIVEDVMIPVFKQGDFYGGLSEGIDSLFALIRGEPLPAPTRDRGVPDTDVGGAFGLSILGGIFGGQILRFLFGPFLGGLIAGVGAGALIAFFGLPILVSLIVGFFVFMAVMGGGRRLGPGGWYGGPGGFGGSSGSGGFRAGGGGFSGGGASGRW
ncbi:YgcG family protein [Methylocaldum sp.]|uniref:TPM domain-containing protein n=1 Tax=Methylocaldum sp. TaxID=1969727 RepID=UPI002D33D222|nr:YgcG family protein [Methylocaldum sp.]HYE35932.1 YgcG family protein [Methylocaldum sp.]